MSEFDIIKVKVTGVKLSILLWQKYQRRIPGLVERVLEINPGLSTDLAIPIGEEIKVPFPSDLPAPKTSKVVRIFD